MSASEAPQQKQRRTRRALVTTAAVAVPVIAALSIAVPLMIDMGTKKTSPDTVAVLPTQTTAAAQVEVADASPEPEPEPEPSPTTEVSETIGEETQWPEGTIDWALPVSAAIAGFPATTAPVDPNDGCSQAQLTWLRENATIMKTTSSLWLTVRNSATTGGALSLGNLRYEGAEVPAEAWIWFECPAGGRGDGGGMQPILLHTDGSPAVYGDPIFVDDAAKPAGSPAVINLAPGEVAQLTLTRDPGVDKQRAYSGRILADVLDGSGESVSLADDVEFVRDPLPGYYIGYGGNPELLCGRPDPAGPDEWGNLGSIRVECTPQEAAVLLLEASGEAGAV